VITAAATIEHWSRGLSITTVALTPLCLDRRVVNWCTTTGKPGSSKAMSNVLYGKQGINE